MGYSTSDPRRDVSQTRLAGMMRRLTKITVRMAGILKQITEAGLLKAKLEVGIELGQHLRGQHNLAWNPDGVVELIRSYDDDLRRLRAEYEECEAALASLEEELDAYQPI